ncbi:hypothetical protein [Lapillicoccus sp.]|uniref:hypothetical protein n=1 Tax=Lapillicoccus sp. TaxID=1909287 RepID=UPI0025E8773B|nr:hypothetical protein [Lapillicoccus sp.]
MIATLMGDPSSCSQLGGDLRTRAATLLTAREALADARSAGSRAGSRLASPDLPDLPDLPERDQRLLDTLVDRLDAAGAALQRYAQELAEQAEELRRLEAEVSRAGLTLDGLQVVEPWGLATVDAASHRRAELPGLAARAERLASRVGRSRGALQRTLTEATGVLARAAADTRASLGR